MAKDLEVEQRRDGDVGVLVVNGEMQMEGAMTMQPLDAIDLPAGETVVLEPGGLHMMMLDLAEPLESGEQFDLTLTLDNGDEVVVEVEVREDAP